MTNFFSEEEGAVTVDFVVLTGGIVGLGIAVLTSVGGGTTTLGDTVSDSLSTMEIADYRTPVSSSTGTPASNDTDRSDDDAEEDDD